MTTKWDSWQADFLKLTMPEFALTRVLDRPVTGRIFFEQVIRENLDIGRPGQVQLIFDRHVNRRTPGDLPIRTCGAPTPCCWGCVPAKSARAA
jgi:hypothetical protein